MAAPNLGNNTHIDISVPGLEDNTSNDLSVLGLGDNSILTKNETHPFPYIQDQYQNKKWGSFHCDKF